MPKVTVTGLTETISSMENLIRKYPTETRKFLNKEGNKMKTRVKNTAKSRIRKRTGNYLKGITKSKPYQYYKSNGGKSKDSVKVYGARPPANHTHLIEQGHRIGKTEKRVRAFYIYRDALNEYESTFSGNCAEFANKMIEEFGW